MAKLKLYWKIKPLVDNKRAESILTLLFFAWNDLIFQFQGSDQFGWAVTRVRWGVVRNCKCNGILLQFLCQFYQIHDKPFKIKLLQVYLRLAIVGMWRKTSSFRLAKLSPAHAEPVNACRRFITLCENCSSAFQRMWRYLHPTRLHFRGSVSGGLPRHRKLLQPFLPK